MDDLNDAKDRSSLRLPARVVALSLFQKPFLATLNCRKTLLVIRGLGVVRITVINARFLGTQERKTGSTYCYNALVLRDNEGAAWILTISYPTERILSEDLIELCDFLSFVLSIRTRFYESCSFFSREQLGRTGILDTYVYVFMFLRNVQGRTQIFFLGELSWKSIRKRKMLISIGMKCNLLIIVPVPLSLSFYFLSLFPHSPILFIPSSYTFSDLDPRRGE